MNYTLFLKWIMPLFYFSLWLSHPQDNLSGLVNQSYLYQVFAFLMATQVSYTLYRIHYRTIAIFLLIALISTLFFSYLNHPQIHLVLANTAFVLYTYPFLRKFQYYPSTWKIISLLLALAALSIVSQGTITGLSEYSYLIALSYFYSFQV